MTIVMSIGIGVFIAGCACAYVGLKAWPEIGQFVTGVVMASVGLLIIVHEAFEIARDRKHREE